MTVSDKVYLSLATPVALVIVVVATMAGLWWWLVALICLLLVVGGLFLKQHLEHRHLYSRTPPPRYPPPPPPQPITPESTAVQGLVLPSAQRDYRFLLNTTVLWRPVGTRGPVHPRPAQLAIDAIRERATMATEREPAANSDLLAPRLAADLSLPRPDRTGQWEVWAQDTTLTIPDDDRVRLHKLARVRKDEEVWEHERAYERSKRTYLREDVLSSTGNAVVWWLAKDDTHVQETVGLIDTLAKLVAAAQDREVTPALHAFMNNLADPHPNPPPPGEDFVDRLMAELLPNGTEPQRADVADRLASLAADAGATELAHTLRERFNAPDFTAMPEPELFDVMENGPDTTSPVHPNGQSEPGRSPNNS